jgi:hypothetical protein
MAGANEINMKIVLRNIFPVLVCVLLFSGVYADVQDDYAPQDLPALVGDFGVSCALFDETGRALQGEVDGVAAVRMYLSDPANDGGGGPYALSFYIDGYYVSGGKTLSLPFDFPWNFKGKTGGSHGLVFILRSSTGKRGIIRMNVLVRHGQSS